MLNYIPQQAMYLAAIIGIIQKKPVVVVEGVTERKVAKAI